MLLNEKYKGEALLQRSYTVDFLSKKRVENKVEIPQYYVEESHPAIIDKEIWEAVLLERERRKTFTEKYNIQKMDYIMNTNPFAGRIICGCCGRVYGRKTWNSNDERLKRIVWQCNNKYATKGKKDCNKRHVNDEVLYMEFVSAFNAVLENREHFMSKWNEQINSEDILERGVVSDNFHNAYKHIINGLKRVEAQDLNRNLQHYLLNLTNCIWNNIITLDFIGKQINF